MDQLGGTSARIAIMHDELVETLRRSRQRRSSSVLQGGPLLVVPFDQLPRSWSQITKQSSGAMVRSGSEVDLCGRRCRGIAIVRSLAAWVSLCPGRHVDITTLDFLLSFPSSFPCQSTRGRTPDSSPASYHPPRNL